MKNAVNEKIVDVFNVTKTFNKGKIVSLSNVSFSITKGSFHALVGENGSGKSTIAKIIVGSYSEKKYSGYIKVKPETTVSFMPQSVSFPMGITVFSYLYNIALFIYENVNEAKVKVNDALNQMDITDLSRRFLNGLSGGQKKKVALCKLAIENANLIILDEPAAALDFGSRSFLFSKLKKWNENGKTIVVISHLVKEVEEYVNEMSLLNSGILVVSKPIRLKTLSSEYMMELNNVVSENEVKNENK